MRRVGARHGGEGARAFHDLRHFSTGGASHATQSRLDPSDVAPAGFIAWHMSTGGALATARGPLQLELVVRDLADRRYRPFPSRSQEFADAPGRVLQRRVSMGTP